MTTLDSLCLRMLCCLPMFPLLACDLADPEEEAILERSSSDFTTHIVGPCNYWSEQTPYLSDYVDLVCDPSAGCTNMPAYERLVYDVTSDDPIFVRGKTDGDGGMSNGISYEKFVSSGHWAPVTAPYIIQLHTPYTENGQQVTDTTFRVVHQVNSDPWRLKNGVYETPSTVNDRARPS